MECHVWAQYMVEYINKMFRILGDFVRRSYHNARALLQYFWRQYFLPYIIILIKVPSILELNIFFVTNLWSISKAWLMTSIKTIITSTHFSLILLHKTTTYLLPSSGNHINSRPLLRLLLLLLPRRLIFFNRGQFAQHYYY